MVVIGIKIKNRFVVIISVWRDKIEWLEWTGQTERLSNCFLVLNISTSTVEIVVAAKIIQTETSHPPPLKKK